MQRHFSNRGAALAEAAAAKASAGRKQCAKSAWASQFAREGPFVHWRSQAPEATSRNIPAMKGTKTRLMKLPALLEPLA